MSFGNSLGDVWKSDIASLLTPLLRATSEARNHPYLQVAITCVRHVCSQHRLTAYPYLFELPLRMNGMRRTQSDHACLDRLGWARCKGRRDRTQATSWFPLAWIQTLLVNWTTVIYFKSVLFYVLGALSFVANAKIGRVVYLTDKCQ